MFGQLSFKYNIVIKSILMFFDCFFFVIDDEDMCFKKFNYMNCVKRSFYCLVS